MPKTYRVGDTDYQFPDSFSDSQVQSILMKQGVIKSTPQPPMRPTEWASRGVALPYGLGANDKGQPQTMSEMRQAERYRKAYKQDPGEGLLHNKQGTEELSGALMLPAGKAVLAAPTLKAAGTAALQTGKNLAIGTATGTATGYGAKTTAEKLGAPPLLANVIGAVAGLGGMFAGSHAVEFLQSDSPPTIGNFLKWMASRGKPIKVADLPKETQRDIEYGYYEERYGKPPGTAQEKLQASAEAKQYVKSLSAKPELEPGPQAPRPVRPNPNIKARFSPPSGENPAEATGTPSRTASPKVKPSERAAGFTKPGEAAEAETGQAPKPFKPNPKIAARFNAPKGANPAEELPNTGGKPSARGTGSSQSTAKTNYLQHLKDRGPLPPAAQAEHLARYLKANGISAEGMTESDWRLAASAAGLPEPTPEVIQAARGQLSWRPSPRGTLRGPQ